MTEQEKKELKEFRENLPIDMRLNWWWARNRYLVKSILLSFLCSSLTSYLFDLLKKKR